MKTRAAGSSSPSLAGRTVVITQGGEYEPWSWGGGLQAWQDALGLLKLLAQGEADVACGRVVPQRTAFDRARGRLRTRG